MAATPRQIHTAAHMRHVAVDAQQLIAVTQALALRVHQQKNRPTRMVLQRVQNGFGLRQCGLNANGGVVGGADHGQRLAFKLRRAAEHIAIALNRVLGAEKRLHQ